jgi:hypothetical protein
MLVIKISPQYYQEKSYVISILFEEILGIDYKIERTDYQSDYIISFEDKKLIIEDCFFKKFSGDLSYLSISSVPDSIVYGKNPFTSEKDIPIIFGSEKLIYEDPKLVTCGIDIFSSAFFLLTRWEEHVSLVRDKFERFPAQASLLGKENILHRPIVNEYVEMIWKMLKYMGYEQDRKPSEYEFIATHDIDQPIRLVNLKMLAKSVMKNLLVYKSIFGATNDFLIYGLNKITPKYDVGNSYDFLIQCSEELGIKSIFNFQNSKKTKYDWGYSNTSVFMQNIFKKIKDFKHIIGFHPSFYAFNDPVLWKNEYESLCEITQTQIKMGRQHFLRFSNPSTWQIWEDNNLEYDFTLGYPEKAGFRCGTCSPYSVFNILTRKKLILKESPLILMDVTLMRYQKGLSNEEFINITNNLISIVKKYKGKFVFLWHNAIFDQRKYTHQFYKKLLSNRIGN